MGSAAPRAASASPGRPFSTRRAPRRAPGGGPHLCFGMGRSYGDVCLNEGGRLIVTDQLDRIMAFDRERGILRAEAGLTLDRLLRVTVPARLVPAGRCPARSSSRSAARSPTTCTARTTSMSGPSARM